jgi:pimeloyl-ACP methyl ester carboxylesterase
MRGLARANRTGRVWRTALAGVLVGALVAAAGTSPAGAAGSGQAAGDPTNGEADVQIGLITTAGALRAAAQPEPGWVGITVDATGGALVLYWYGDLPPTVSRAVSVARRSATVTVRPSRYSERTLLDAGARIMPQDGVTSVAPLPDGSGIAVGVTKDADTGARLPLVAASAVRVVIEPFMHPVLAVGRQHDDVAPYHNGSMYHWPLPNNYIGLCTTGFALDVAGQSRILSAGHCGTDGQTMYAGNGGAPSPVLGTVSGDDQGHDTLLLNADGAGETFYGGINGAFAKPTHMVLDTFVNTLVCTSGAMTGQHCKIRIKYVDQTIKVDDEDGNPYLISPVVRADQDDKDVAVGQGDSGGPVVAQDSSVAGFVLVYPTGTITAEDSNTAVACGIVVYPTMCAWRMFYADVPGALVRYGATAK